MAQGDDLKRLNEISSAVSERDLKIWENVAHSVCIKKQTEKLKAEIARMKAATIQRQKENKVLEEKIAELDATLTIQHETLKTSKQSVVMQKAYKESLAQEADDFRKKYSKTLEMYNDELQAYRNHYENASQSYKELEELKINLKKLEIRDRMLDANIASATRGHEQYMKIQEKIFHKTMVKLAEFHIVSVRSNEVKLQLQEKRKEEQQLMKEHLKLAEAVKQKKRLQLNKANVAKEENPTEAAKEKTEMNVDKLQKFLSEEIPSCSLTSMNFNQRQINFCRNNSKVKILDMKVMKSPKVIPKKSNVDLRKKMESIMQAAREDARKGKSLQASLMEVQRRQEKVTVPSGANSSQQSRPLRSPKPQKLSQEAHHKQMRPLGSQAVQKSSQEVRPSQTAQQNRVSRPQKTQMKGSQEDKQVVSVSQETKRCEDQKMEVDEPLLSPPPPKDLQKPKSLDLEVKGQPKDAVTSILKPPSQDNDKQENVSKYFNPKKKSVTFQNEAKKETSQERTKFQLFSQEKIMETVTPVRNMDIFQKSFCFKNEAQKCDEKNKKEAKPEKETGSEATGTNLTFSKESRPTTFGTYGDATNEKENGLTFDLLEASFSCAMNPSEILAPAAENTIFDFFGSQSKPSNPFNFF